MTQKKPQGRPAKDENKTKSERFSFAFTKEQVKELGGRTAIYTLIQAAVSLAVAAKQEEKKLNH